MRHIFTTRRWLAEWEIVDSLFQGNSQGAEKLKINARIMEGFFRVKNS